MKYELVKKLKDARFPFNWDKQDLEFPHSTIQPTLEELIEACGDRFNCLFKHPEIEPKKWIAGYMVGTPEGTDWGTKSECLQGIGDTPREAVANLWLALNIN